MSEIRMIIHTRNLSFNYSLYNKGRARLWDNRGEKDVVNNLINLKVYRR
jgi:hypothetical protein